MFAELPWLQSLSSHDKTFLHFRPRNVQIETWLHFIVHTPFRPISDTQSNQQGALLVTTSRWVFRNAKTISFLQPFFALKSNDNFSFWKSKTKDATGRKVPKCSKIKNLFYCIIFKKHGWSSCFMFLHTNKFHAHILPSFIDFRGNHRNRLFLVLVFSRIVTAWKKRGLAKEKTWWKRTKKGGGEWCKKRWLFIVFVESTNVSCGEASLWKKWIASKWMCNMISIVLVENSFMAFVLLSSSVTGTPLLKKSSFLLTTFPGFLDACFLFHVSCHPSSLANTLPRPTFTNGQNPFLEVLLWPRWRWAVHQNPCSPSWLASYKCCFWDP